jgi:hypothetical protein
MTAVHVGSVQPDLSAKLRSVGIEPLHQQVARRTVNEPHDPKAGSSSGDGWEAVHAFNSGRNRELLIVRRTTSTDYSTSNLGAAPVVPYDNEVRFAVS